MKIFQKTKSINIDQCKHKLATLGVIDAPFMLVDTFCDAFYAEIEHTRRFKDPTFRRGQFNTGSDYFAEHPDLGFAIHMQKEIFLSPLFREFVEGLVSYQHTLISATNILHIYKPEHELDWHMDKDPDPHRPRLIGLSIILNEPEKGGEFQIKNKKTGHIETVAPKIGKIHFFNVSDDNFEHRVAPASGNNGRMSISGWYLDLNEEAITQEEERNQSNPPKQAVEGH